MKETTKLETDFALKVKQKVDRLQNSTYRELELEVAQKRVSWFKQNHQVGVHDLTTPRKAFELLFFEYMGLSENDVPILSETKNEIVWSSINKCSNLEACLLLELDTRKVCREVYEKSTQAFLSQLDPQLRFHRSYEEIRPHSHHCREMIVRINFERMMEITLEEAKISKSESNKGYGAIIVLGSQILGKAHDTAVTENDPSLHAELNAIRQAVETLGDSNLCGAVLFSTCEPCPMCSSLAVWTNLTTLVYGVSIEETAKLGRSRIHISSQEVIDKSPAMIEIIGGVLKEKCKTLYT